MSKSNFPKYIQRRIDKYNIPCKSVKHGNPIDGYDYSCDYEKAPDNCEDCICCGGHTNPETGKRCYKRKEEEERK